MLILPRSILHAGAFCVTAHKQSSVLPRFHLIGPRQPKAPNVNAKPTASKVISSRQTPTLTIKTTHTTQKQACVILVPRHGDPEPQTPQKNPKAAKVYIQSPPIFFDVYVT